MIRHDTKKITWSGEDGEERNYDKWTLFGNEIPRGKGHKSRMLGYEPSMLAEREIKCRSRDGAKPRKNEENH